MRLIKINASVKNDHRKDVTVHSRQFVTRPHCTSLMGKKKGKKREREVLIEF